MIDNLVNRLRIKAGVIENCEPIAWGSDTSLMREAADRIEQLEAERDAAHNCGLEDAAEIADKHLREAKKASSMARPDEVTTKVGCWAWGRAAEKIAAQIRHQIQED